MSIGFRIFLLILFGFGTVYAYRFRAADLDKWLSEPLWPSAAESASEEGAFLENPVDGILSPEVVLAFLHGPGLPSPPSRSWDEDTEDYLPPGEIGAEDLVLMDPGPSGDGLPPDGDGPGGQGPEHFADESDPARAPGIDESGRGLPVPVPTAVVGDKELFYTVKSGDNLWKIAAQHLGAGFRFKEILELNRDLFGSGSSHEVKPGMELKIRIQAIGTEKKESLKVPRAHVDTSVEASSASGSNGPEGEPTHHKVRRDENLRRIARRYLPGQIDGWKRIFEANKDLLDSAHRIREGQVLTIPSQH
jgi:hypothetical protein